MAKREDIKLSISERYRRHFSEGFKRQKVKEIELGKTKVSDISKQYQVTRTNVYRWLAKYGSMQNNKPERIIIEAESDTRQLLLLKKKIAELERIIGQKQIVIDFHSKMIDLAEEAYGIEIKKNFSTPPSNTSGTIGKDTGSV